MKNSSIVIAALALLASSCPKDDPVVEFSEGTVVEVVIHSPGLEGNMLGDSPDRSISIYLPPGYESSEKRYPVVYLLVGFNCGDDCRFGPENPDNSIPKIMNRLIYDGTIEPMILVAPDSYNRFKGSFYLNSIVSGNWQDYIVYDVVQFVDNTYRTIANSESRGILGHSMGGYGTLMIAMKYPEIFSTVYAHGSWPLVIKYGTSMYRDVWKDDFMAIASCNNLADFSTLYHNAQLWVAASVAMIPNPSASPFYFNPVYNVNGHLVDSVLERFNSYDPSKLVPHYKENLIQLNAFKLDCGENDEGCYPMNVYFANILDSIGIENDFEPYDGGHSDKIFERIELSVLPFFSEHFVHEN